MGRSIRILAGRLTPTAGSHIYNRELIRRLKLRGHDVSVICLDAGDDNWSGINLHELAPHPNHFGMFWRIGAVLQGRKSYQQVRSADLETPDVVIAAEHLFLKAHAERFPKVPWIYLPHSTLVGTEIDSYQMGAIQKLISKHYYVNTQRWALRHASSVMRFNQFAVDTLRDHYSSDAVSPFWVNPVGIHCQSVSDDRPTRARPIRLLSLGRLAPMKNLDFVIQSLSQLKELNWTLDVVGDGPELQNIQKLVRYHRLEARVVLRGHQSNTDKWYGRADLLLFPSRLESMGLVLLEAMAHGVPALAIRNDGVRYQVPFDTVIEDGVTGLLARDEGDFQMRLADVIRNPQSLVKLSGAAMRHARVTYTWEQHLELLEKHIDRLCTSRICDAHQSSTDCGVPNLN